jgi:hypothetical protein
MTPTTNENAPILKTTIVIARKSIPTLLHEFQEKWVNTMWVDLDFRYSSGLRFLENLATPITNENATIAIARRTIQSLLPRIARRRKMVRYKARIQRFISAEIPGNVDDTNNYQNAPTLRQFWLYLRRALLAITSAWASLTMSPFALIRERPMHLVPVPSATTRNSSPADRRKPANTVLSRPCGFPCFGSFSYLASTSSATLCPHAFPAIPSPSPSPALSLAIAIAIATKFVSYARTVCSPLLQLFLWFRALWCGNVSD